MANQAKGKTKLATKKPSKVAGKKSPNKLSKQADKASQATSQQYIVFGVVLSADAKPAVGLTVFAYDNDVASQDLLGQALTDAKGAYAISYNEAQFKRTKQERGGADIVVSVLNAQQKVLFSSKKKNNAPAKFELNIQLLEEPFTIKGVVRDSNGKPQANVIVRAFGRDLRKEQLLGKASTNKDGSYEINYTAKDFASAEGANAKPDLLVRIYSDANKKEPILTSETRFNASRAEVFDFTIVVPSTPEFEQVSSIALPILKNQNTDGKPLPPNELTQEDIDFIVKDTGLNQSSLTAWVASNKMQKDALARLNSEYPKELNALNQDGWPFFYAFARQGYAESLYAVLLQNAESWNKAWQSGVAANRVADIKKETISLLTSVLSLMLKLAQLDPEKNADNPFARVLSALDVNLPSKVALAALDIVQQHGIDKPDELLKLLKIYPAEKKSINTLVRGIRVNNLVSGDAELFTHLNKQLSGDSDSIAPLAKMKASEWIEMADKTSVSKGALLRIQANVERQHPLIALQSRLDGGQLDIVSKADLNKLIKENGKKAEAVLQGKTFIKTNSKAPDTLKTLQSFGQFARAGINMEMAGKLMQAGVKSPAAAVREGQGAVNEKIGDNYGIEAVSDVVSNFFEVVEPLVEGANAFLIENGNRHLPYGVKDDTEPVDGEVNDGATTNLEEVLTKLPDLPTIFGDLDECMCRPCESMLGLPAYLVDLLNLLKKSDVYFIELNKKRPDIAEMELSCDKAETVELHINIVLEILEPAAGIRGGGTEPYQLMASEIYPWKHLPYQKNLAETNAYLNKLGVSRFDFLVLSSEITGTFTAETLNLSMDQTAFPDEISEWKLLTEKRSGAGLWAAHGFKSGAVSIKDPVTFKPLPVLPVKDVLTIVSVLLDRTGLTLDDLDKILETESVGKVTISKRDQCKTSEMNLQISDANREEFFDKLHRFVRLKNKLPQWTIMQLDDAIMTCGGLSPAQSTQLVGLLNKLATIKRLCNFYGLPIHLLLEVSKDIDKLPKLFGLTAKQWKLLKAIVGVDIPAQANFDWDALEWYCDAIKRIAEAGLTIEQVAEAKLTRTELKTIFTELPTSVKSDKDIKKELDKIQERLGSVVVIKADVSLETQAVEALTAIFDETNASKIVEAVNRAGAKNAANRTLEADMRALLTTKPDNAPDLGAWQPLLHESKANEILTVSATNKRNANERFELLLNGIAEKRRERELVLEIVEFSGLPEMDVVKLLSGRLLLDDDPSLGGAATVDSNNAAKAFLTTITAAAKPRLHVWLDRISRLSVLSKTLGLDSDLMQIADSISVPNTAGGVYWRGALASGTPAIPAKDSWKNHWRALLDLIWLQHPEQLSLPALDALLKELKDRNQQSVLPSTLQALAIRFEISNEEVLAIAQQFVPVDGTYAITLRNPSNLRRIFQLLLLAKKLKANASKLAKLVNLSDNATASITTKALLRAKVGEQAWQKSLDEKEKVLNPVRQQSRDALVAYLVHHQELRDANDLYEKYLIDPKIEPCFETTRLLEAVTATQLFIQRILFGLESQITADPKLKQHWVWMRNYRVWEANRKVFLFPENWLYPELRDDKSSSFNLLESALGQGELTKELAEEAFGQFLDDVAQMGQIEVLGMYEDVLNPTAVSPTRNLYVVGRTPNPPYAYYWRKCIDFGSSLMEWSPWHRIELDIQGDHVMPFVLGGSFHIAWPIIKYNHQEPKSEWEIKLAWSMHDGKSWQKSKISRKSANIPDIPLMDDRWGLSFRAKLNVPESGIKIDVYALDAISNVEKTTPDSTSSDGGSYIFKPEDGLSFIENLIKGGKSGTSTTEEFRNRYSDLPVNLRELLEAHWMVSGKWRAIANNYNDLTIDSHGGDAAYANFKVEGKHIFTNPVEAIEKQILLKSVHKHLENVAFSGPGKPTPHGNSFEESLNSFLTNLKTQNNSYFSFGFKDILAMTCSSRHISCEVWLRVKIPDNTSEDLVLLDGKQGTYSCPIEGQNLSPLTLVQIHKLGEQPCPEYTLSLTINRTGTNPPPLTAKSKAFPSTTTIPIPKGRSHNQTLRFELNGLGLAVEDLRYLGVLDKLETSRSLVFTYQFHLSPDNHLTINKIVQKDILPNPVISSRSWMNGYEETSSTISNTSNPITISSRPVLKSSPLAKFWAVGSATVESSTSQIWHFSDGGLNAYVDLKYPSNSDLLIYADSYKDATQYRVKWSGDKLLFQPDLATGSFSAKDLFNVLVDNDTKLWLKAHDKELAKNDNFPYKSDLAFDNQLPYACYNWEVFFHAPLMIADQLSKQHKFEEAERWLRYVFDPTDHNATASDPNPFFKFKVFKELDLSKQVIDDLTILAKAASVNATTNEIEAVKKLIERWRDLPFRPFVIARRRHIAFLWSTLFAYLDNLIAWADSLFRRDTRESINEAVMLYVLVEKILGRRPQQHDGKSKRASASYNDMAAKWDDFANAWVSMGANIAGMKTHLKKNDYEKYDSGGMLYFCMPFNDKILSYWNIVDDRLFNVRHCLNIEGIERKLPFTDPPIDLELLIRATAAGLDLGDVISGLYAPPPHYRYGILSARAAELANEAKSLGAAMLSAMEKRDAEHMSQLRSSNEISMLKLVKEVRTLQITEAERNLDALRGSRKSASTRFTQYQRLLGKKDIKVPAENESVGEESMLGSIDGAASQHSSWGLIKEENEQYIGFEGANTWSIAANIAKIIGSVSHTTSSVLAAFPQDKFTNAAKVAESVANSASVTGDAFSFISQGWRSYAEQQGMMAGHIRRRDEWAFQSNQTLKELQQIDKQILANEIRIAITKKELDNHIEQIEQTQAMDEVMRSKFSNVQLYEWMSKQLYSLYDKTYRMALDMARRAERAAARELGVKPLNILKNDYWDSLRMGLLAGERLHHDLKRLEVAYLDQNRREFELTKHISLRRLNPEELLKLRFTRTEDTKKVNTCEFNIPEWLFDLDTPGHYLRRIKSVSVSIPCVVGPYTSISCKLTLLKSSIRHDKTSATYPRTSANETNFTDYYGASEAVVTSTASGDSGMFETQLRDERFLPFEGSGVISTWRLELPADYPQFDYSTISDVILSIRYTARDGGLQLRNAASGDINTQLNTATSEKLQFPVLLSCKSDFPTEWAKAKTNPSEKLIIPITKDLIPYWMDAAKLVVRKISHLELGTDPVMPPPVAFTKTTRSGIDYADLGKLAASTDDVIVILYVGK